MENWSELLDLLMLLTILSSIVGWIVVFIGRLKCRRDGRCPKSRICKDTECKWGLWCNKYDRYSDKQKYLAEILRELEKKEKERK